jgi:biotin carboxyl carrier protein
VPLHLDINGTRVDATVTHAPTGPDARIGTRRGTWHATEARVANAYHRDEHEPGRLTAVRGMTHFSVTRPIYDVSSIDDGAGSGAVRAPINGRVAKVFVTQGQRVAKGDRIAIVEAMKMEHSLVASSDGEIEKLAVREGQQVTQGTVVATIV